MSIFVVVKPPSILLFSQMRWRRLTLIIKCMSYGSLYNGSVVLTAQLHSKDPSPSPVCLCSNDCIEMTLLLPPVCLCSNDCTAKTLLLPPVCVCSNDCSAKTILLPPVCLWSCRIRWWCSPTGCSQLFICHVRRKNYRTKVQRDMVSTWLLTETHKNNEEWTKREETGVLIGNYT